MSQSRQRIPALGLAQEVISVRAVSTGTKQWSLMVAAVIRLPPFKGHSSSGARDLFQALSFRSLLRAAVVSYHRGSEGACRDDPLEVSLSKKGGCKEHHEKIFLILSLFLPVTVLVSSASLAQSKLDASIFSYDGKDFVRTETTLMKEGQSAVGTSR